MRQTIRWLFVLIVAARPVASFADPATPATPAVPGGGNPHSESDHAATPAVPATPGGHDDVDVNDLDERATNDFAERHPEVRDAAKAKWDAMTPEQREAFLRDHPRLARRAARRSWDQMNPRERAEFLREHPEIRQRIADRLRAMSPEERREFLRRHPKIERQIRRRQDHDSRGAGPARRAHHDNGVRDHGAGQGRDGHGQGGERRRPAAGSGH